MEKNSKIEELEQDCWRRIGIWGNESTRCEKLKFVKHCRDCEVFEQAARVSAAELRRKTGEEDLSIDEMIEKELFAGNKSIVPFRIGNTCFGLPSSAILTISDQVAIHSIPHNKSPVVRGLVAINHEVYTFISLRELLGLEPRTVSSDTVKIHSLFKRTLVVNLGGRTVVFYVDEVYQIHRYFENQVMLGEELSNKITLEGILENKSNWCSSCHLLNLPLTEKQLEAMS